MIHSVENMTDAWDVIIIGGGATGLGAAVDAASRGYKTVLLEMSDFAKGTSSRSTKLAHGGVRYLQQGNIPLVWEALNERAHLMKNAPHLVQDRSFIVPFYNWWQGLYYGLGLKIYDMLSGRHRLGASKFLSSQRTLKKAPTLIAEKLKGSIMYHDGQFDDTRLAINLAQTSADLGGTLINYMKVTGLLKSSKKVQGVQAKDVLTGKTYELKGRVVINATGVYTDRILKMDDPEAKSIIKPSQGVHIIVDKDFLPGNAAIMIPKTTDGRILFALPWHNKIMIGTTDTPVNHITDEPKASKEEIEFILKNAAAYLRKNPTKLDIQSVFAGLRPLVQDGGSDNTATISREHSLMVSSSELVTIAGGKWTTYRKMAKDVIDKASVIGGLEARECRTEALKIHGWIEDVDWGDPLHFYGSDKANIKEIIKRNPEMGKPLHSRLPYVKAEVIWATRSEMAMIVEDFNARRTRALFLDAKASVEMAPEVARLMAAEAGYNDQWIETQINEYTKLAQSYQI
jgi:glycerol-3-phosphate dehydrogenase